MEFLGKNVPRLLLCICLLCLSFLSCFSETSGAEDIAGQSSPTSGQLKRSSEFETFIEWVKAEGAKFNESVVDIIPLAATTGEKQETRVDHAVISRAGCPYGTDVIQMPPHLWVVSENITQGRIWKDGREPAIGPQVGRGEGYQGWDVSLALWLLLEKAKGEASPWAPYLSIIPESVPNSLAFTDEDVNEIQYQPFYSLAEGYRTLYMQSMWAKVEEWGQLPEGWNTFEQYRWASSIVWSRTFTITASDETLGDSFTPVEGVERPPQVVASMMIPFMDMLNHDYPHSAEWKLRDGKATMTTVVDVEPGTPISCSYGSKGNDMLLATYGFVLDHNPYDKAECFQSMLELVTWYERVYSPLPTTPEGEADSEEMAEMRAAFISAAEHIANESAEAVQTMMGMELGFQLTEGWHAVNYTLGTDEGMGIFTGALMDPRMIAAFTALVYAQSNRVVEEEGGVTPGEVMLNATGLDMYSLAWGSVAVAMAADFNCKIHAHGMEPFFRFTAEAITWRVKELLNSYPTTAEEDKKILDEAKAVESGDCSSLSDGETKTCPFVEPLSEQRKLIVKLRMMKKETFKNGMTKLASVCPTLDGESIEDGNMNSEGHPEVLALDESEEQPWLEEDSLGSDINWADAFFGEDGTDAGSEGVDGMDNQ